ncbi:OmpH family outer membrane protein [Desulfovibrio sp. OttesenSCG-928-I05]|nr:OmpH family outer membrane protein [Desulfovibrio sp. OttesenSCG-928-I05]
MRKSLFLSLALAVLLLGVAGTAQAEMKIGVFNSRAVAAQCAPAVDAGKKLDAQFANEKSGIERASQDLQKQADELQAKQSVLSPEAWEDLRIKFNRQKRDFEDRYQSFVRKVEAANMRVQQEFMNNLFQAAQEYGSKNGYSVLLDSAMGGPIFYDKTVDVTEAMIAELTRVYGLKK